MLLYSRGATDADLNESQLREAVFEVLDSLGPRKKVLVIPPDFTRFHSMAGQITELIWHYYGSSLACVLPALGTHAPMTISEISAMFGELPASLIKVHNWRNDILTLGEVPIIEPFMGDGVLNLVPFE